MGKVILAFSLFAAVSMAPVAPVGDLFPGLPRGATQIDASAYGFSFRLPSSDWHFVPIHDISTNLQGPEGAMAIGVLGSQDLPFYIEGIRLPPSSEQLASNPVTRETFEDALRPLGGKVVDFSSRDINIHSCSGFRTSVVLEVPGRRIECVMYLIQAPSHIVTIGIYGKSDDPPQLSEIIDNLSIISAPQSPSPQSASSPSTSPRQKSAVERYAYYITLGVILALMGSRRVVNKK